MTVRTVRLCAAVGVAALATLTACSSSGGSPGGGSSSGQTGGVASTSTAAGASVVSAIKARGVLRVAVAAAPPYMNLNTSTNKWEGVSIDFADLWAKDLGVKVHTVQSSFATMVAGLQAGRFDLAPALNKTPEREGTVAFSSSFVTALSVASVFPDRKGINSWNTLNQSTHTICVASGSSDDTTLTQAKPKAKILRLTDLSACRLALQSGRAEAVSDEWHSQGQFAAATKGVKIIFPPTALGQQDVDAALKTSATTDDIASLNKAISEFQSSGELGTSMKNYGSASPIPYAVGGVPAYASDLAKSQFGS